MQTSWEKGLQDSKQLFSHYVTIQHMTFHFISSHYITSQCGRYIALHYISCRYITLHYASCRYITLHCITLHYITLHVVTLHHITLHDITLCYITVHYITVDTLHYIRLHYIMRIMHYITLHSHSRWVFSCVWVCVGIWTRGRKWNPSGMDAAGWGTQFDMINHVQQGGPKTRTHPYLYIYIYTDKKHK